MLWSLFDVHTVVTCSYYSWWYWLLVKNTQAMLNVDFHGSHQGGSETVQPEAVPEPTEAPEPETNPDEAGELAVKKCFERQKGWRETDPSSNWIFLPVSWHASETWNWPAGHWCIWNPSTVHVFSEHVSWFKQKFNCKNSEQPGHGWAQPPHLGAIARRCQLRQAGHTMWWPVVLWTYLLLAWTCLLQGSKNGCVLARSCEH